MKIKSKKGIDKKLDDAWSKLVKLKAGMQCEYCFTKVKQLHSHHIYSRGNIATRWDLENGICLCASHHVLSSKFSAHKTGMEFFLWLEGKKGRPWIDRLRLKANSTLKLHKFEKELILKELQEKIKSYD